MQAPTESIVVRQARVRIKTVRAKALTGSGSVVVGEEFVPLLPRHQVFRSEIKGIGLPHQSEPGCVIWQVQKAPRRLDTSVTRNHVPETSTVVPRSYFPG